jgi:hypothetical protein
VRHQDRVRHLDPQLRTGITVDRRVPRDQQRHVTRHRDQGHRFDPRRLPANAETATYRAFGSDVPDQTVPYGWGGAEGTRRRKLGLVIRPKSREVLLVMDDQVIWSRAEPNLQLGVVRFVSTPPRPAA